MATADQVSTANQAAIDASWMAIVGKLNAEAARGPHIAGDSRATPADAARSGIVGKLNAKLPPHRAALSGDNNRDPLMTTNTRSPLPAPIGAIAPLAGGQKAAEAEHVQRRAKVKLKYQTSRVALDAAVTRLAERKAALAKLEAREGLADDPAAIREHLAAEEVERVRVGFAEKEVAAAQAALAPMQAEVDAVLRETAWQRMHDEQREILARFPEAYATAASALFNLLSDARANENDGAKLVKAGAPPEGVEPFVSRFQFFDLDGPVSLMVQLVDSSGNPVWQGREFSDGMNEV